MMQQEQPPMNAERLLAHYERIADAPDAIARLRRFILDLAVRGKLVPQDANDEPASELLKRIAKEKARLVKAGEIRTPKAIPALAETPFSIPSNWRWSQLAEIGVLSPRNEAPDTLEASFVPMLLIAAEYGVSNQHEIRPWGEIKKGYTHFAEGDVGLAKITPCFENGKSAVFRNLTGGLGAGTTELHIVRPLFVDQDFILLFLKSPHFIETGIPKMTGTAGQKRVPTEYFAHSPFPLPPLAEQHRIVTKVDELMGLCDRLEAARGSREATRDRLAAASLARLNAPDPETFEADARFTLNALPALTTRPDQIKRLRQTILNLAVRGKLAPQGESSQTTEIELESLVKIVRGSSPRPKGDPRYYGGPVPRLLIADITRDGKYVIPQLDTLTVEGAKLSRPMPKGSLVLAISGSYGVPAFLAVDACIHDGFIGFRDVSRKVDPEYLFLVMLFRRPYFDDVVKDSGLKNLTTEHLKRLVVPLPPLAEQHRIVAKVDALMALCDRLEASLTATAATRRRLLDALLAEALAPVDTRELEATE